MCAKEESDRRWPDIQNDVIAALRTGFVLGADWLREEIEAVLDQYTYEGVDGFSYGPEPEDVWRMVRDLKAVMKGTNGT